MENSLSIQMTLSKEENGSDQKDTKEKENGQKEKEERKEDIRQILRTMPTQPPKRALLITVVPPKRLGKKHTLPKNGRNGLRAWHG